MNRCVFAIALVSIGALHAGCTQDFGQFESLGLGSDTGGASSTTTSGTSTGTGGASTTSTTSTSGGSSSTTSSGGSSTTSTAITEDCTNGVDDDGDGDADCADAKCQPVVACVPQVPFQWTGPVVLYDGPPSTVPSECPAAYPTFSYEGRSGVKNAPAECSTCTCGDPRFNCALKNIVAYTNNTCSGQGSSRSQSTDCQQGLQGSPSTAKADAPTVSLQGQNNGSCMPSQVQTTKAAPEWTTAGLACGGAPVTGGGCTSPQFCAPRPPAGFASVMCIHRDGDHTCPAAFPDKHTYVKNAIDTRGCSACACGAGEDLACSAVTTIHEPGSQCNNSPQVTIPNDGSCVALQSGSRKTTVTKEGSCPASGGAPTGAIVDNPADTVTVCCLQL